MASGACPPPRWGSVPWRHRYLEMVLRLRGSLLITGGGLAAARLAPTVALAVGPLAVAGAARTAVECARR